MLSLDSIATMHLYTNAIFFYRPQLVLDVIVMYNAPIKQPVVGQL